VSEWQDANRVIKRLRRYDIEVNEGFAELLAADAGDREAQMLRLLAYDLTGVDSAVEVTRRGRR